MQKNISIIILKLLKHAIRMNLAVFLKNNFLEKYLTCHFSLHRLYVKLIF